MPLLKTAGRYGTIQCGFIHSSAMSEKAHNTVLTVTKAETGVTLQNFLAERLKLSKRGAKDLIDQRQVWVNRQCIWMARHLLRGGDTVEAQAGTAAQAVQSVKRIRILSETDRYLFADKPYGMLTIGPGGLEEALREQTGNSALRCVHRLDKDTSGCLLVAKDDEAFDAAVSVFKTRRVKKLYEFLAVGRIETAASTIATPIDDEPAKTTIRRIAFNNDATFGSARIETGRTRSASTSPPSATRWSATGSTASRQAATRASCASRGRCSMRRSWSWTTRLAAAICGRTAPCRPTSGAAFRCSASGNSVEP